MNVRAPRRDERSMLRPLLAALMLLVACTTPYGARPDDAAPEVAGYRGVVVVAMPGARAPLATYPALLRRTTDPARGQVVDETIVDRGGGSLDRSVVVWDAAASPCAVTEL